MWILIIIGGGLLVTFTSIISIQGYVTVGPLELYYGSIVKAIIAIILVIIWIYVLIKIKDWMFHKKIKT
ncbi:MAG TPA: hypothetical protein VLD38_04930 [Nitrosopumilaceae archaeon]|nr:hypothetical protein [Nitrosopumilaceae archaeon]